MNNRAMTHAAPGKALHERPLGHLWGWEPTEQLFLDMIATAGFRDVRLVSTSPHAGEVPGRKCGNRTYCVAAAAERPPALPLIASKPLREFSTSA